jgi:hypothetical protein
MKSLGIKSPVNLHVPLHVAIRAGPPFRSWKTCATLADKRFSLDSALGALLQGDLEGTMEPLPRSPNEVQRPLLRTLLPSTAPRGETASLPPKRHRVSRACAACRARKTKVYSHCPTARALHSLTKV